MNTSTLQGLFGYVLQIINGYVVPIIFAIGFVMFLWGIYRYFIAGGADQEKVSEGRKFLLWSLIGFAVMVSVWGLINLFVNTLGFNNSAMPCIPTFGAGCAQPGGGLNLSGSGSNGNSIFGNTSSNPTGLLGGTPNTGGVIGGAGSNGNGSSNGVVVGNGSPGAGCTNNTQCTGELVCNVTTASCTADSATTYSCADDSTPTYSGLCANGEPPTNSNGDAQSGGVGASCTNNTQCSSSGTQDIVCNDATQTCAVDSANTYSCLDDSTPDAQGNCANGQAPTNSNGDESAADGSVPLGGSCAGNEDACASGTCNIKGVCADSYSSSDTGTDNTDQSQGQTCSDGTVSLPGTTCAVCSDGSTTGYSTNCPTSNDGSDYYGTPYPTDTSGDTSGDSGGDPTGGDQYNI